MSEKNKKQMERIKNILVLLSNVNCDKVMKTEDFSKYFSEEDLPVLYSLLTGLEKETFISSSKPKSKVVELKATPIFELEYTEITPYTILGIEEDEYTKEVLLNAVSKKIYSKRLIKDQDYKNYQINKILDAYNEIKQKRNL